MNTNQDWTLEGLFRFGKCSTAFGRRSVSHAAFLKDSQSFVRDAISGKFDVVCRKTFGYEKPSTTSGSFVVVSAVKNLCKMVARSFAGAGDRLSVSLCPGRDGLASEFHGFLRQSYEGFQRERFRAGGTVNAASGDFFGRKQ